MTEMEPRPDHIDFTATLRESTTQALLRYLERNPEIGEAVTQRAGQLANAYLYRVGSEMDEPDRTTLETGIVKLSMLFSEKGEPVKIGNDILGLLDSYGQDYDQNLHDVSNALDTFATYAEIYRKAAEIKAGTSWSRIGISQRFWVVHHEVMNNMPVDAMPPVPQSLDNNG